MQTKQDAVCQSASHLAPNFKRDSAPTGTGNGGLPALLVGTSGVTRKGERELGRQLDSSVSLTLTHAQVKPYGGARAKVLLTAFVGAHSTVGNIFCPALGRHSQRR
jgi:hypothetical protein